MVQRSAALRAAPVRVLLTALVLLLGAVAPAASALAAPAASALAAPGSPGHAAPNAAGARTADGPCAAECDRTPLLHRDAAAEPHAPHPAGAALPVRARRARTTAGIRPPAPPPHTAARPPYTARHQGRAPPPSPDS
ncbi:MULTISPECIES: hypothetical protein [Streptomyces]|uniref:Uncharacterized protein n=1 Tax=Streptomyces pini TaxID=1520580 RepID=A0A1I4L915_9ACTN|nr:hypothetical protein [Streptomyces pini]SFL87283.1 hypothetical protein SAMN05192584_13033 [Streptomyces pini]